MKTRIARLAILALVGTFGCASAPKLEASRTIARNNYRIECKNPENRLSGVYVNVDRLDFDSEIKTVPAIYGKFANGSDEEPKKANLRERKLESNGGDFSVNLTIGESPMSKSFLKITGNNFNEGSGKVMSSIGIGSAKEPGASFECSFLR